MILLVVAVGALAQCGLSDPLALRGNYTSVVACFNLKQRIAFRIGQVECLKTLLSEGAYRNAQYGLGALHRGNYTRDISRFDLKQRIAFLLGQVQCLKIHIILEGNNTQGKDIGVMCCKIKLYFAYWCICDIIPHFNVSDQSDCSLRGFINHL